MITLLLQIFWTFFVIGLFTFGGGYAMLSLIHDQVVTSHEWMTESAFTDIVAISQMTPGPIGINCATYVGYDVVTNAGGSALLGVLGSMSATLAVVLPSFIIVLILAKFYMKIKNSGKFETFMQWLRPCVPGLIGAAAILLMFNVDWSGIPLLSKCNFSVVQENFPDWKSWLLFGGALVASLKFKVGPIPVIIAGALAGLLIY